MVKRQIEDAIRSDFGKGKIILVLGAWQVITPVNYTDFLTESQHA